MTPRKSTHCRVPSPAEGRSGWAGQQVRFHTFLAAVFTSNCEADVPHIWKVTGLEINVMASVVSAVTGFISAVIGELLTGRGALGQLQLETRLPQNVINWAVFGIVVSS